MFTAIRNYFFPVVETKDVVKPAFKYTRMTHVADVLKNMSEEIPIKDDVLETIKKEILNDALKNLTHTQLKNYLKRCSLMSYYEHTNQILRQLNGVEYRMIPENVTNEMLELFRQIQDPFDKIKKQMQPERDRFLSYNFVFRKFLKKLDREDLLHLVPEPSSDDLLIQEEIWKGICEELKWD